MQTQGNMTTKDVAELLGFSTIAITTFAHRGLIKGKEKTGEKSNRYTRHLFPIAEVLKFKRLLTEKNPHYIHEECVRALLDLTKNELNYRVQQGILVPDHIETVEGTTEYFFSAETITSYVTAVTYRRRPAARLSFL